MYVIFQTTVSIGILSFKIINQFELAAKGVKFVIFLSTGLKINTLHLYNHICYSIKKC